MSSGENKNKHSTLITILIASILFYFYVSSNHNAQLEAMKYERTATIGEANELLRSQGYRIRFRSSVLGLSMVYPGSKKLIRAERKHDRDMNKIYGKK